MNLLIILLAIAFLVATVASQKKVFTLPGDPLWPTRSQIQNFASAITGHVLIRGDAAYVPPTTWNSRAGQPSPLLVVTPKSPEDISTSLKFAHTHLLRVSVLSTGFHQDMRNTADDSVHINMATFNHRRVDLTAQTLTVGPAQPFIDMLDFVAEATGKKLVALSGSEPGVGPAGWVLGGGHGKLTRLYGLGVDALISVDMVTGNGTLLTASESSHQELFRAVRGGGGPAFGIIHSLTFKLFPDPGPVTLFTGFFPPTEPFSSSWQTWMSTAPNNAGSYALSGYDASTSRPFMDVLAFCFGNPKDCVETLAPLAETPDCVAIGDRTCKIQASAYPTYNDYAISNRGKNPGTGDSLYLVSTCVDLTSPTQIPTLMNQIAAYNPSEWFGGLLVCYFNGVLGGASSNLDVDGEKTSMSPAVRQCKVAVSCAAAWQGSLTDNAPIIRKMDILAENIIYPTGLNEWSYWNEPQHNSLRNATAWQQRYWGGSERYERLLGVKKEYDPENVLTCHHCVGSEDVLNVDPVLCPFGCKTSCSNVVVDNTCKAPTGPLEEGHRTTVREAKSCGRRKRAWAGRFK
ncbi:hypothetical protein HDU67_008349 [Dinochytrium kinnereticum]|nr:hypothetical protein HDU67_008349 [Dinochytrium kinnereticum]